jgi:hypothetical protein
MNETLAALAAPFADDELEERPIRGRMYTYPKVAAVVRRLNAVAGLDWSCRCTHTLDADRIVVYAELTIGTTTRGQYGAAVFTEKADPADTAKKAASLALRKAAMQFGIALYLALPETDAEDTAPQYPEGGTPPSVLVEPGQDDDERPSSGAPLDASYLAAIKAARVALDWTADQVRDLAAELLDTRDIEHLNPNLAVVLVRHLRAQATRRDTAKIA